MKLKISKILIIQLLLFLNLISNSQTFDFIKKLTPPPAPQNSSMFYEFSSSEHKAYITDIDNDGDDDIINFYQFGNTTYINDGFGNFNQSFNKKYLTMSTSNAYAVFYDFDNDGDIDPIVSRDYWNNSYGTHFYQNDGTGNFRIDTIILPFVDKTGFIAASDVNNDNNIDILLTYGNTAFIYLNQGQNNYIAIDSFTVAGVDCSAKFADINNDSFDDLILCGNFYDIGQDSIKTFTYINDGTGNFSVLENPNLENLSNADIELSDIDNDNDLDLLLAGSLGGFNGTKIKLYKNDGTGIFTSLQNTAIDTFKAHSALFIDYNNDGNEDIFAVTYGASRFFINDGLGNFTINNDTTVLNNYWGIPYLAKIDIEKDGDFDLFAVGYNATKLYIHEDTTFTEIVDSLFLNLNYSSDFYDIDNDNDIDFLSSGNDKTVLYLNDGVGNFNLYETLPFNNLTIHNASFGDVDNDNDIDILVSAEDSVYLYLNNGNLNYVKSDNVFIDTPQDRKLRFVDIDNDNDLDIIITGYKILVYENNGMGNFQLKSELDYGYQYVCDFEIIDIDKDNDKDFVIMGSSIYNQVYTGIYINDGFGNYTADANNDLIENYNGNVAVADVDNDGDEDFFVIGEGNWTELYINDGLGNFTHNSQDFPDNVGGSIAEFADFDNDGDMDLIISGSNFCNIYDNNGSGIFTKTEIPTILNYYSGQISVGDIDDDNDIDLLINGRVVNKTLTSIYENITPNSVTEIEKTKKITYYPNPTKGLFSVYLKENYKEIFVEIKNELGQVVKAKKIENVNTFNLTLQHKGFYIVTIKDNKNMNESFKIIMN